MHWYFTIILALTLTSAHAEVGDTSFLRPRGAKAFERFLSSTYSYLAGRKNVKCDAQFDADDRKFIAGQCPDNPINAAGAVNEVVTQAGKTAMADQVNVDLARKQICSYNRILGYDRDPNPAPLNDFNTKRVRTAETFGKVSIRIDLPEIKRPSQRAVSSGRVQLIRDLSAKALTLRPIVAKLKTLETEKGRLTERIHEVNMSVNRTGSSEKGAELAELGRQLNKVNADIETEHMAGDPIMMTIPMIEEPEIQKFVNELTAPGSIVNLSEFSEVGKKFQFEVVDKMKARLSSELDEIKSRVDARVASSDYQRNFLNEMVEHGWHHELARRLRSSDEDRDGTRWTDRVSAAKVYDKLNCHLDVERFGRAKAKEYATTAAMVLAVIPGLGGVPVMASTLYFLADAIDTCTTQTLGELKFTNCDSAVRTKSECELDQILNKTNCDAATRAAAICTRQASQGCDLISDQARYDLMNCAISLAMSSTPGVYKFVKTEALSALKGFKK
jgi:hypothetical protein